MDKVAHLCMYFGFMSAIIFETFIIAKKRRSIIMLALIPFFYGIIMEVLQGLLTTTRSADVYDAMFNTAGILLSIVFWLIVKSVYSERFKKINS
jgi:VanZ family protein